MCSITARTARAVHGTKEGNPKQNFPKLVLVNPSTSFSADTKSVILPLI